MDLDRRPPLVRLADVAPDGLAPELPRHCEVAFAMITAAGADIAVVYAGSIRGADKTLRILDVDAVYFRPGLFSRHSDAASGFEAVLSCFCGADFRPRASGRAGFRAGGRGRGDSRCDPELSLIFAAYCIAKGLVRFCAPVVAKMQTQTIGAALALKAGDPETALRAALIAAIYAKYGEG